MANKVATVKGVEYALRYAGESLDYDDYGKWRLGKSGVIISSGVVAKIRNSGMVVAAPNGNLVWRED